MTLARLVVPAACAALAAAAAIASAPSRGDAAPRATVVSLTFDDGTADQYRVRRVLRTRGVRATFFVSSGIIGRRGYLTWRQLRRLRDDGHEIGGHSLTHANLMTADAAERRRQVCVDRQNLRRRGFAATTFAHPYGTSDAALEAVVRGCGYRAARGGAGRLWGPTPGDCGSCPPAETIPPLNRYHVRAISAPSALTDLQAHVLAAERHGGGWLAFGFHNVCNGCSELSVSLGTFVAFVDWLRGRAARGTVIRPMRAVAVRARTTANS